MHRLASILIASLITFTLAGCLSGPDEEGPGDTDPRDTGPSEPTPPPTAERTVTFSGLYGSPAGSEYTTSLTVESGVELTVTFENNDQNQVVRHDWYLEALDVRTEVIAAGESDSVTFLVDLQPGDYVYYCTVEDHRDNGMEGFLTVTAPST